MVSSIKTDPELIKRLKIAAKYKMTPKEKFKQKVSFVYGQMNGKLTKDEVRQHLLNF